MDDRANSGDPDHHFAPPPPPSNTDYRHARWPRFFLPPRSHQAQTAKILAEPPDPRRVVVVGVCSAGKSTLVKKMQERGYRVRSCAQEHSYVPHLWQLTGPDVLVYLDASLRTIHHRSRPRMRQSLLDEERERLAHARHHCHLYIATDGLSPDDIASRLVNYLNNTRLDKY